MAPANCSCINDFTRYKQALDKTAALSQAVLLTIGVLPFALFALILLSIHLFVTISIYFRVASIDRLCKKFDPTDAGCRESLLSLYKDEQQIHKKLVKLSNIWGLGWLFRRIANELEDRAETLVLIVDKKASESIDILINKIEQENFPKLEWRDQLNAL